MYSGKNLEKSELKGNETILLVDDEDIIWDVVIDMLQNMGYTVILAANGREAVEIYKSNPGKIDLVLLDMVMPELNGREAYFELKKFDNDVTHGTSRRSKWQKESTIRSEKQGKFNA